MIFIYDRNESQIDILDVKPKFTREFGKFNTLEFESIREYEKGYRVVYLHKGKIYEFIITDTQYERENGYIHSYFCQDSIIELKGTHISDKRPKGSYKDALNSIFENTRWELEFGSYSETYNQSNSFFRINVIEAFEKIVKDYDIEWETKFEAAEENITKRIVVIKKIGNVANSRLEFGKNIKKFTRKVGAEPIITGLYGYGKGEETENGGYGRRLSFESINNGKEYVENVEALNTYGIGKNGHKNHYFDTVIFENIEDKQELLRATKKELEIRSKPKIEYTVDAANLHIDFDFGDEVAIIDNHINFRGYKRIIKVVYLNGIEFTFGDITSKFTDSVKSEIANSEQKIKEDMTSAMDSIIKNTSIAFFNQDSYTYDFKLGNKYNLPAGLYSFNKPIEENPTKATYVGGGQVLISNEKGTDNEWIWKSAITGDGIHGETIITNTITVNKLAADVGRELNLASNKSINEIVQNSTKNYMASPEVQNLIKSKDFTWNLIKGTNEERSDKNKSIRYLIPEFEGEGLQKMRGQTFTISVDAYTNNINPVEGYKNVFGFELKVKFKDGTSQYISIYNQITQNYSVNKRNKQIGTVNDKEIEAYEIYIFILTSEDVMVARPKMEWGIVESPYWTPHISEVGVDVNEYYSLREQMGDLVTNTVGTINSSIKDLTTVLEQVESKQTQTSTSFDIEFSRLEKLVEGNTETLNEMSGFIRSGLDSSGIAYSEWGSSNDSSGLKVTSNKVSMYSGNTETLRLEGGAGYMDNLYVEQNLYFANHKTIKHGTEFTIFVPK